MDWTHLIVGIIMAVGGWFARHWSPAAHHSVIDDALAEVKKSKIIDDIKAAFSSGSGTTPIKPA